MSNYLALYLSRDSSIGLTRDLPTVQFHLISLYLRILDILRQFMPVVLAMYHI